MRAKGAGASGKVSLGQRAASVHARARRASGKVWAGRKACAQAGGGPSFSKHCACLASSNLLLIDVSVCQFLLLL